MDCDYELLDFGNGRKLERFGSFLLDRPSPSAESFVPSLPRSRWQEADARFVRQKGLRGTWQFRRPIPETWNWRTPYFTMELKPTDVGHLGIFPEQRKNWEWLYRQTEQSLRSGQPFRVLNLFGYTGGSSLAVAAAFRKGGITVEHRDSYSITHLDAAANVVQWARRNATLSQCSEVPIRWIAEDAVKFVRREERRGKTYEGIILDPPSYGHGKKGEVWRLEYDLPILLTCCAGLLKPSPRFVLLTVHSPGYPASRLVEILRQHFPSALRISPFSMSLTTTLTTTCQQYLPSGEGAVALF
ncbi:MAG: class I SAM-dependent methyltransferase [Planctomycetia bacterium]|nr:class I SAM-dependent methyltransferase [Planctomycetia bacterium]